MNKHNLKRYLTSFFVLNKDLLLKSRKLTTVGLKATNIRTVQRGESLAFVV